MSDTCPHGFAPAECLICRTLGSQPQVQVDTGDRSASGPAPPPRLPATAGWPPTAPTAPNAAAPPDGPGRQPRSHGTHVAVAVAGLVAIGVVAWIVVSVVFTLLHVLELLLVAALAAWAGYRVGYFRGRRHRGP
jgi:hypothetical protein